MKYALLIIMLLFSQQANAKAYSQITFDNNETLALATLPMGAWWKGSVRSSGDFGSGTLTIQFSTDSTCTTKYSEKDLTGSEYTATDDDSVNIEFGTSKTAATYLCATLAGATAPSVVVQVFDYQ